MVSEKDEGGYWSIAQAARWSSVSEDTMRRWIDAGKLTKYQVGRRVMVSREELTRLMQRGAAR